MPYKYERHLRRRLWSTAEKELIADYLAYKIAQLNRLVAHYEAIPLDQRTRGNRRALESALERRAGLIWALPGGRGQSPPAKG